MLIPVFDFPPNLWYTVITPHVGEEAKDCCQAVGEDFHEEILPRLGNVICGQLQSRQDYKAQKQDNDLPFNYTIIGHCSFG